MRNWKVFLAATIILVGGISIALAATPPPPKVEVHPWLFDPAHTDLASSDWVKGLGCPTLAKIFDGSSIGAYLDLGCPSSDPNDQDINGLVLGKQGPTGNYASGGASVKYTPNSATNPLVLSEIGYDLRIDMGSHCGAGAPRFNIVTTTGKFYFLACDSPAATIKASSLQWKRLRWGDPTTSTPVSGYNAATGALEPITDPIKSIDLVFDEGSDSGTGIAILDNIDVNGTLGGH